MDGIAYKHITAEEFAKIDQSTVTVVDLREPDEVLVSSFENRRCRGNPSGRKNQG